MLRSSGAPDSVTRPPWSRPPGQLGARCGLLKEAQSEQRGGHQAALPTNVVHLDFHYPLLATDPEYDGDRSKWTVHRRCHIAQGKIGSHDGPLTEPHGRIRARSVDKTGDDASMDRTNRATDLIGDVELHDVSITLVVAAEWKLVEKRTSHGHGRPC